MFYGEGVRVQIYKLHKALYRLKQAPRTWYNKMNSYFTHNNFHKSANEPTLYVKISGNLFLMVYFYVDAMAYTKSFIKMMNAFRNSMMNAFEMTDLGILFP